MESIHINFKLNSHYEAFGLCRSGYEAAAKSFAPSDLDVNLSGRSFVITGANSGIGKATAQEIANRGKIFKLFITSFKVCPDIQYLSVCVYVYVVSQMIILF